MWLYHRVMSPNDADGMADSVYPDQTASLGEVWSGSSALFAQAYLSKNLGHHGMSPFSKQSVTIMQTADSDNNIKILTNKFDRAIWPIIFILGSGNVKLNMHSHVHRPTMNIPDKPFFCDFTGHTSADNWTKLCHMRLSRRLKEICLY